MPVVGQSHYEPEASGITCGPAWSHADHSKAIFMHLAVALGLAIPFAVLTFSYFSILLKVCLNDGLLFIIKALDWFKTG